MCIQNPGFQDNHNITSTYIYELIYKSLANPKALFQSLSLF